MRTRLLFFENEPGHNVGSLHLQSKILQNPKLVRFFLMALTYLSVHYWNPSFHKFLHYQNTWFNKRNGKHELPLAPQIKSTGLQRKNLENANAGDLRCKASNTQIPIICAVIDVSLHVVYWFSNTWLIPIWTANQKEAQKYVTTIEDNSSRPKSLRKDHDLQLFDGSVRFNVQRTVSTHGRMSYSWGWSYWSRQPNSVCRVMGRKWR